MILYKLLPKLVVLFLFVLRRRGPFQGVDVERGAEWKSADGMDYSYINLRW